MQWCNITGQVHDSSRRMNLLLTDCCVSATVTAMWRTSFCLQKTELRLVLSSYFCLVASPNTFLSSHHLSTTRIAPGGMYSNWGWQGSRRKRQPGRDKVSAGSLKRSRMGEKQRDHSQCRPSEILAKLQQRPVCFVGHVQQIMSNILKMCNLPLNPSL